MRSHVAVLKEQEPVSLISPIHSSQPWWLWKTQVISFCRVPNTESFRAPYCQQLHRPQCTGPSSPASWCWETKCFPLVFITLLVSRHVAKLLSQNDAACSVLLSNLSVHVWISLTSVKPWSWWTPAETTFIIVKGIANESKHISHFSCIAWYTYILEESINP